VVARVVTLWDPVVRTLHWVLVFAFTANYFVNEAGEQWHEWLGYLAAAAVLVRFAWGFRDTGAARWSAFWPTRRRLAEHARALLRGAHYPGLGHSPIGAVVMVALLLGMFALGVTGFMMEEIDYFWGEDWMEQVHGSIADAVAALACLHMAAALLESLRLRENLPWSMVTGRRRVPRKTA
jgi:cytochrome b